MSQWDFTKGLHEVSPGVFAYLLPQGQWGLNNAGLIVDGESSMLVDTLFDLDYTRDMLSSMRLAAPAAAATIDTLIITHGNGDHFYGSELVAGAEIICTSACAEEMLETPPQVLAELIKAAPTMGDLGAYILHCFDKFNFEGINPLPPTQTFDGRLELQVGEKPVHLIEVGPAHTRGDMIVHLPDDGVVFAGDILFIGGTPIMWAGPVSNWIKACDLILELNPRVVVPGHGPITDSGGVTMIKKFWEFMRDESFKRFQAGMSVEEAVADIPVGDYAAWVDSERIVVNVDRLFAEFRKDDAQPNVVELFSAMAGQGLK